MLVARKGTKNKRPVVDFRLLNTRIMRRNTTTPLLRDMYNPSGSQFQTGSRKIQCHFVGPLAIYKCISPNQFFTHVFG